MKSKFLLQHKTLSYRILIPILVVLGILLLAGINFSRNQLESDLTAHVANQVNIVDRKFHSEIDKEGKKLEAVLELLIKNRPLLNSFYQRDRDQLFAQANSIFQELKRQIDITHWYFSDAERINFLRVHDPERHGDRIDRQTTLTSARSKKTSTGVELGPLGTLTLRSVKPLLDNNGQLLGFIEVGIDVSDTLQTVNTLSQAGLFLIIEKELVSRQNWEQGQRIFGGLKDWDFLPQHVISNSYGLDDDLLSNLPTIQSILSAAPGKGPQQKTASKTVRWESISIDSMNIPAAGQIILAINVSEWISSNKALIVKMIMVYSAIALVLFFLVFRFLQRAINAELQLKQSFAELNQLASFDQLTGLPNRNLFITEVNQRIAESKRFQQPIAFCFIDLDNFKFVNDTMGHDKGDLLLQKITERLLKQIRKYDVLARFGGDEFILMMPHIESKDCASVLDKILISLRQPITINEQNIEVTLSIGVSMYPADGTERNELLRNADAAMYQAKEAGRNCYRFFTAQINQELMRQQQLSAKLRQAISNDELQLHYQPKFDLATQTMKGCEALLRWFPKEGGSISPMEFIPIAEKNNLIIEIGEWVLNEACRQRQAWKQQGIDITIDVNLSPRQIFHSDIYTEITHLLEQYELDFTDIGLELTENILIEADQSAIASMKKLVDLGTSLAIDDFGTGYSSLSYLKKFPVTHVKIDKEFIRDAHQDPNDKAIITAIVAMSHSLGLGVIAEGIETDQQQDIVIAAGCDQGQGFLYQKPQPADELVKSFINPSNAS